MGIGKFLEKWKRFVKDDRDDPAVDPVASLQKVVRDNKFAVNNLVIAWEHDPSGAAVIKNRREILLCDGDKTALWVISSLQELFRGARLPPSVGDMERYPEEYVPFFYFIEGHVIQACDAGRQDPIDDEFARIYSEMRRRPEGKSLGTAYPLYSSR